MNSRQKEYGKDRRKTESSRTLAHRSPLSYAEVARVVRACFSLPNQTGKGRDRGDGGQR